MRTNTKRKHNKQREKGSALANDQAPASQTTWLRPHERTEEHKIERNTIIEYRKTGIITSTRLNKVIGTGTQRPHRRLRQRAQAERPTTIRPARPTCAKNKDTSQKETQHTQGMKQNRNIRTYIKNRTRYNRWLENKGWWGTTADNRVPPRGTVGEPRHISSMNANLVSNHARNKSDPLIGRGIQYYYKIRTPPKRNKTEEEKDRMKLG